MTCKDCIHEKVCDALIKSGCPYLDEEVPADAFCMEFRNTADVVPKSEVEELEAECERQYEQAKADILANMADGGTSCHWCIDEHKAQAKAEVAREIFEEIEKNTGFFRICAERNYDYLCIFRELDELKKKYTEIENG